MTRHPTRSRLLILAALSLPLSGCAGNPDIATSAPDATSSSATSSGDPSPSAAPPHLIEMAPLAPGPYQISVFANPGDQGPEAIVEVPSGYNGGSTWFVVSHDAGEFLGLWFVGLVARDACTSAESRLFDPGPSVKDLASALVAQKSTRASAPKPVTLAGYRGLYVELASPHDTSRCEDTGHMWESPGGRGPGSDQVDLLWILDVDGQRVVVDAAYNATSTAADIHKLTSMVESLEFLEPAQE
jgi:hypothetical protein